MCLSNLWIGKQHLFGSVLGWFPHSFTNVFISVSVSVFKGGYECVNWLATYILWVRSMCWYRINQLFNWYPRSTQASHNSINETQRHESTFLLVLRLKNEKLFYAKRSVLSVKKVSVNETRSVLSVTTFSCCFV